MDNGTRALFAKGQRLGVQLGGRDREGEFRIISSDKCRRAIATEIAPHQDASGTRITNLVPFTKRELVAARCAKRGHRGDIYIAVADEFASDKLCDVAGF